MVGGIALLAWSPLTFTRFESAARVLIEPDARTSMDERRELIPRIFEIVDSRELRAQTDARLGYEANIDPLNWGNVGVAVYGKHVDPDRAQESASVHALLAVAAYRELLLAETGVPFYAVEGNGPWATQVPRTLWHLVLGSGIGAWVALAVMRRLEERSERTRADREPQAAPL